MIWIQENKGLAALFGFFIVAILGVAAYDYLCYSDYSARYSEYESTRASIKKREAQSLYPDDVSKELVKEDKERFKQQSIELYDNLVSVSPGVPNQTPLDEEKTGVEFQGELGQTLEALKRHAEREGVVLPDGFAMGFDEWIGRPALKDAVPKLDFMLGAINDMLSVAIDSGISEIRYIKRHTVPEESESFSKAKSDDSKSKNKPPVMQSGPKDRVERYTFELVFRTPHDGLQKLMNILSNKSGAQFPFFTIRRIEVRNENERGPSKEDEFIKQPVPVEDGSLVPPPIDPGIPPVDPSIDPTFPPSPGPGTGPAAFIDVRTLIGNEKLNVYMMIDVLRFIPPEKDEKEDGEDEKEGNDNNKA